MPILSARVNLNKRHTPEQHMARRDAAFAALYRIYCDVTALWRLCAHKRCRRHRCCCGDSVACVERGWSTVPRGLRPRVRAQVRAGGPARVPPINNLEWEMRQHPPSWVR